MQWLREEKLYAKMKEYKFGKSEVEYIGYIVGFGKLQVDLQKVQCMKDQSAPTSFKELQQFLGFANYCNRSIRSLDPIALPIPKLLQQYQTWIWGIEQ